MISSVGGPLVDLVGPLDWPSVSHNLGAGSY